MRTTNQAVRGLPLTVLFLVLLAGCSFMTVAESGIRVRQTIEPDEIYIVGTGELGGEAGEIATLRLHLRAVGPEEGYPIDCVLIIDTSATADLEQATEFAVDLVDQFKPDDRIGLVTYATKATLEVPLTDNRLQIKSAISGLTPGGKSALGLALEVAHQELQGYGRDGALLVEVLLSDGQSNAGVAPEVEGTVAEEAGITIVSVGIGTLINRSLLDGFAGQTNGRFFPRPTDTTLAEIIDHLTTWDAARAIEVERRLSSGLRFVQAAPTPDRVVANRDGTTTVGWQLGDLLVGEEQSVTMEIEAIEDGMWEVDVESGVTYADFRGVARSVSVPAATLFVVGPNLAPVAEFEFSPEEPTTADVVSFVDRSFDRDDDGDVVAWEWDFGDDGTSVEQHPQHRFSEGGTYSVRLVAVDEQGLESSVREAEITVVQAPNVVVTRRIETCLPEDLTIIGASVDVGVSILINSTLDGLSVVETIPVGWTFVEGENDGATIRRNGQVVEWLFVEKLLADRVNLRREIRYRLEAPTTTASSDLEQISIGGSIGSSSPRFEQPILGEDKLTLTRYLPIPVVISRWDADAEELHLCGPEPGVIDFAGIQKAISLWLSKEPVPYTNNLMIGLETMRDLIAYWLTGSSVHDPLP